MVSILLWEQGIVYLAAILLSLPLGGVLVWLVVPKLVFTGLPTHSALSEISADLFYLLQQAPAPQVIIPSTLQLAWPVSLLICVLALLLMARMILRASYGQELRLNED